MHNVVVDYKWIELSIEFKQFGAMHIFKKNPGASNGALLFSSCLRRGQFTDLSCKPKALGSN